MLARTFAPAILLRSATARLEREKSYDAAVAVQQARRELAQFRFENIKLVQEET